MKSGLTLCTLFLIGSSSSIASAQIASQCANDALATIDAQGRNDWAVNCGYISPAARDFYDADGDHVAFTSGCGRAGCSPFIPVTATAPCVPGLAIIGSCRNGFSLNAQTDENAITITSSRGVDSCGGFCDYAYAAGSSLTIRLSSTVNRIDCLRFTGWDGACAGQGSSCTLTINSDLWTTAVWSPITGCQPCFSAPGSIIRCGPLPALAAP